MTETFFGDVFSLELYTPKLFPFNVYNKAKKIGCIQASSIKSDNSHYLKKS